MPHERAAGEHEVGASRIEALVNEEIFLFPPQVGLHLLHILVEIVAHFGGGHVHGVERAQQRSLVVECLTGIGDEDGGDTECVVDDEHGRCRIPGRVAPRLESVAYAAVGKRTGIGLLLHKQFAGEVFDHSSLAVVLHKGIVLLGRALGQWLKPVGVVGHAVFLGPLLHAGRHGIGYRTVEAGAIVHHVYQLLIHVGRQILVHLGAVEHIFPEKL